MDARLHPTGLVSLEVRSVTIMGTLLGRNRGVTAKFLRASLR